MRYDSTMDPTQRLDVLQTLHSGRLSRNRHFSFYERAEVRALVGGYRRLRSLAGELCRPGIELTCSSLADSGLRLVQLRSRDLRYRRAAVLAPWEFEFLTEHMGVGRLATASPA